MARMHIPDGFLDAGTSAAAGAVAVGGLAACVRVARVELAERVIPLAGIVSAYVFAVQMLNFPVANGTSGHLLGGVLAAVLVGPWVGALCVTVVLAVQALVFADGGLSALGVNVVNMALIGAVCGYLVFRGVRGLVGNDRRGVLIATSAAAWSAPVMASVAFTGEYAVGGNGAIGTSTVLWSMVGVHAVIGIGEAVITTLTVAAVLTSRPDLVHGAQGMIDGTVSPARRPIAGFAVTAAIVTLILAAVASPFASSSPDGLEKVAADTGIDSGATDSATVDSPLADYGVSGIDDEGLGTSIAGIVGVAVTVAVGLGAFSIIRRRNAPRPA